MEFETRISGASQDIVETHTGQDKCGQNGLVKTVW
jgi:hypothetical protein